MNYGCTGILCVFHQVMIAPTKGTQEPGKDQLQRADEIFARITGSYVSRHRINSVRACVCEIHCTVFYG